jgi:hypothetical protein
MVASRWRCGGSSGNSNSCQDDGGKGYGSIDGNDDNTTTTQQKQDNQYNNQHGNQPDNEHNNN